LIVRDDGVGLPQDVNVWNTRSLGLRLVRILAAQLDADITVKSDSGAEITLTLPKSERAR
jgi:two-component sensor histidine kinase